METMIYLLMKSFVIRIYTHSADAGAQSQLKVLVNFIWIIMNKSWKFTEARIKIWSNKTSSC